MKKENGISLLIIAACILLVLAAFFHLSKKIDSLPEPVEEMAMETPCTMQPSKLMCVSVVEQPKALANWKCPLTDYEIRLIAKVTYAEAGNQSEYGRRLVIDTILNRMDSAKCPNTVRGVLFQKNQFSTCKYGEPKAPATEENIALVIDELKERTNYDVFFFRTKGYHRYGTPLFQVEDHYFSKY